VLERPWHETRPLFEQHHRKSGLRQFPRNDSTRCAGPDDGKVNGFRVAIRARVHFDGTESTPNPG
jgi:hypothetical protein